MVRVGRLALALGLGVLGGCASPVQMLPAGLQENLAAETALKLEDGMASRLSQQPQPATAPGTLVMLHGFSAGTWQFDELAALCVKAGYNVYVPRLPGHGIQNTDGSENWSQLLGGRAAPQYEAFVDRSFQQAASLGAPVSALGLSVGGGLALLMAERHPEVKQVVTYSAFMRPKNAAGIFDAANVIDAVPPGLGAGLLSMVPFGWGAGCEADRASGKRPGHCHFNLGNIYGDYQVGLEEIDQAPQIKVPVQFFSTGADDAADPGAIQAVFLKSGGAARNGWYAYPASEGIPHAMISPKEDNGKGHTPALYAMTLKFLQSGTLSNRGDLPR